MADGVSDFYSKLAPHYDLMFEDWHASGARQAAALGPLLARECRSASARVLDCACGIGTQSLGLAQAGFAVTGSDIAAGAVERARAEASKRGLAIRFHVADMRDLVGVPGEGFDAVICLDNALPHLSSPAEVVRAAAEARGKLRPGGVYLASLRDYDRLLEERPTVQGPAIYPTPEGRRIVFQLWDWKDELCYDFHLYITRETPDGWQTHHGCCSYRTLRRSELTSVLQEAGFTGIRWLMPEQSGFYQPLVLATR